MSGQTIAALATAPLRSAVGMIRLSGPDARAAAAAVFRPRGRLRPRRLCFGDMTAGGAVLDQGLCAYMPGPGSYTGEDVVELYCHGSPGVLEALLTALYEAGARPAAPGEFTRRAFLNGRMDLSQAEAVTDLIESETAQAARNAAAQLAGALGVKIAAQRDRLVGLAAHFSAVVDYPEEDIPEFLLPEAQKTLEEVSAALQRLRESHRQGILLRQGLPCAIAGRPNVGKSSLLNALAGEARSIVTEIPGTTRDVVEQAVQVAGFPLRLQDTAGLREGADPVERIGVERARAALRDAALALAVFDLSAPPQAEDEALARELAGRPVIAVGNKCDLLETGGQNEPQSPMAEFLREHFAHVVPVSARTGAGIDGLREKIAQVLRLGDVAFDGQTVTNPRQADALSRAAQAAARAADALRAGLTPDAVMADVEDAAQILGEITGQTASQDILDRIFSRFCVGK